MSFAALFATSFYMFNIFPIAGYRTRVDGSNESYLWSGDQRALVKSSFISTHFTTLQSVSMPEAHMRYKAIFEKVHPRP